MTSSLSPVPTTPSILGIKEIFQRTRKKPKIPYGFDLSIKKKENREKNLDTS
jgi:hypothetical protein